MKIRTFFIDRLSIARPTTSCANAATAYIIDAKVPVTAMSEVIPCIRTSNNLGIRKVIAPKTNPPAAVTKARETKARCQPGANPINSFSWRIASGALTSTLRTNPRNPRPISIEIDPGMIKAIRQSNCTRIKPVTNGAAATPIFPHSPFTPRRQPTFPPPSITIAIPTGW